MPPLLEFRDPALLSLALLALPAFWLARRRSGRLLFSAVAILPVRSFGWRARILWMPPALIALATASLGVALAGPRIGDQTTRVQRKGIAILMAVDVSGSMSALDLSTEKQERTRLDAVKEVFRQFVSGGEGLSGRPDDVIGLVTFARYADCRCPPTLDHGNLLLMAEDAALVSDPGEDGTAIGDGLALAIERLRETKAESKVVILLTDGVQNAGELSPAQAASLATTLGARVYTVGAGTNGFAPVRIEDPFSGRKVLRQVPVQIDESTLQQIAGQTRGRYFRATDAESLRRVYEEIDRLERTQMAETRYLQYREYFDLFVGAGLLAAWLGWGLAATILGTLP